MYTEFDKLNIPIYICDENWRVVFRNAACKKYTPAPRMNGELKRIFADPEGTDFPEKNGGMKFISCFINNAYKTAVCFEYHGSAAVLFPTIIDFDLLFGEVIKEAGDELADSFRELFDSVSDETIRSEDRYGIIEKIGRHSLCSIENYVALSFFDADTRSLGSVFRIYDFFSRRIVTTANKAGFRVRTDLSEIGGEGDGICADTMFFSMVLSGFLLFALSMSSDRRCFLCPRLIGSVVRNEIRFTCERLDCLGREGNDLKDFLKNAPIEYLNLLIYDDLCRALGWKTEYHIDGEGDMNAVISFDIENGDRIVFRSQGSDTRPDQEKLIGDVVSLIFRLYE